MQQSIGGKRGAAVDSSMLLNAVRISTLSSAEKSYATNAKKLMIKTTEQLHDRNDCKQGCATLVTVKGT